MVLTELDELTVRIRVLADEADAELSAFARRVSAAGAQADTAREALAAFAGGFAALGASGARAVAGLNAGGEALARENARMREGAQAAAELRDQSARVEAQARRLSASLQSNQGYEAARAQAHQLTSELYRLEGAAQIRGAARMETGAAHNALNALLADTNAATQGMERLHRSSGRRSNAATWLRGLQAELRELDHLVRMDMADTAAEVAALASMAERYQMLDVSTRYSLLERLHEAQERLRQENLQRELSAIDHQKAMGELSLEQELARLARVRAAHRMTAEEIAALEERVYETTQSLRQRDADAIDGVAGGLTDALKARYQRWRQQELTALDDSRDEWQRWADESSAALQRQIDALDALATAEDRQAQDEKELRQLESLRAQIAYEQDGYNRAMLEASLREAVQQREARLRQQATADEKDALRAQQSAISERLQAENEALQARQAAIEAAYAERAQSQNLAAEAERLLLRQNQEELIALLAGYAPEYNALGQTLGQRLAEGFAASLTDVTAWFDSLAHQVFAAQQQMSAAALQAADGFTAAHQAADAARTVTVQQSNTFNVPVESPADTARRVARANEDLGLLLLGQ